MSGFYFIPPRIQFTDERGHLTPIAMVWLRQLYERSGAASGPSTTEVADDLLQAVQDAESGRLSGVHVEAEWLTTAPAYEAPEAADSLAPPVVLTAQDVIGAELAGLRERVRELEQEIAGMQLGRQFEETI